MYKLLYVKIGRSVIYPFRSRKSWPMVCRLAKYPQVIIDPNLDIFDICVKGISPALDFYKQGTFYADNDTYSFLNTQIAKKKEKNTTRNADGIFQNGPTNMPTN